MKLLRLCLLVPFAIQLATPALEITPFKRTKASAVTSVADSQFDAGRKYDHIATDEDPGVSSQPTGATAKPETFVQGGASAVAIASASAQIGHLGLSVTGLANGVGTHSVIVKGQSQIQAGAQAQAAAQAEAEWVDNVTLSSPGRLVARDITTHTRHRESNA